MARPLVPPHTSPIQDRAAASAIRRLSVWAVDTDKLLGQAFKQSGSGSSTVIVQPTGGGAFDYNLLANIPWTNVGLDTVALTVNTKKVGIGTSSPGARTEISNQGAVGDVVLLLRGKASQTGDIIRIVTSGGQIMAKFDKLGQLYLGNGVTADNAMLFMGGHDGVLNVGASNNCAISWGSNANSIGSPTYTADYIGCPGARIYTYKDPTGQYDNGYGQDALDSWVLVNDDGVTYTIWTSLTNGNNYLRARWAGNGDLEQRGIINIKKGQHNTLASTPALRLWSTGSTSPTRYMGIQAAATVTGTYTLIFPAAAPSTKAGIYVSSAGAVTFEDTPPLASTKSGAAINATNQGADIATANLLASGHTAGMYRVSTVIECTTSAAATGTVTMTAGWTDDVGATTLAGAAIALTGTGRNSFVHTIYSTGAAAITYAVANSGAYSTAKYAVQIRVEFLG